MTSNIQHPFLIFGVSFQDFVLVFMRCLDRKLATSDHVCSSEFGVFNKGLLRTLGLPVVRKRVWPWTWQCWWHRFGEGVELRLGFRRYLTLAKGTRRFVGKTRKATGLCVFYACSVEWLGFGYKVLKAVWWRGFLGWERVYVLACNLGGAVFAARAGLTSLDSWW